jgi:hypothetical protein
MKTLSRSAIFASTLMLTVGAARAAAPSGPQPITFDEGRGTIEVIERLRYEDRDNTVDFNSAAHAATDDSWFVQRIRLGATWKPDPLWSIQVQLQDAREWGSERPNVPFIAGSEGDDPLDLRLAAVTWGDPKKSPFVLTVGRQLLGLGEERLVGSSEWNNFARTFDAIKGVWSLDPGKSTVTAFASSVVTVRPTTSGQDWEFNHSSMDDLFGGVNFTEKLSPSDTAEAYVLWRDKKNNNPIYSAPTASIPAAQRTAVGYDIAQEIYTIGARFIRAPKEGAFDGEFEGALQGGHVNRQTTTAVGPYGGSTEELDQQAWALHALVGYTPMGLPGKLRLDFEYNIASGDSHRSDDKNGTFMNLFPSNHKFYGFMDVFSWKNVEEMVATIRFAPLPKTTVRIDYHDFSLFTTSDAWYRSNGVSTVRPLNDAARHASRHAGDELDITATWTPVGWATIDLGYAKFFAGDYLRDTGANSDADFVYVQTSLKF